MTYSICTEKTENMYEDYPDPCDFWDIDWCENCRHESCVCPEYVESQRGTMLWMHEDMGAMMIPADPDVRPWNMLGKYYHEIDPESGADNVYRLMEYMTGPSCGYVFQVKKVGDRETLPDRNGRRRGMGRKPRITH